MTQHVCAPEHETRERRSWSREPAPGPWPEKAACATPQPVLSARLASPSAGPATPILSARLSPTGSRCAKTPGGSEAGRGGLLNLLDIGILARPAGDGSQDAANSSCAPASPLSPIDTTLLHLKHLMGVGGSGVDEPEADTSGELGRDGADQQAGGFELKLGNFLHGVAAPAIGRAITDGASMAGGLEDPRSNTSPVPPAATPILAKLKPSGPPKTLCRDLPKRQAFATKILETPKAIRMRNAIEAEVIVEQRAEGLEEEEEDLDETEASSRRHSAPATSLYMPSLVAGRSGAREMAVVEEEQGGARRHSAPAGTLRASDCGATPGDWAQDHAREHQVSGLEV